MGALTCFLIAVAAGLISDNIAKPRVHRAPPPEVERVRNGWGEPESFVGRYSVNFLSPSGRLAPTAIRNSPARASPKGT